MFQNYLIPFLLTLIAGLSTGIGSALAFFTKKTNTKVLSFSLGLSAGVMIFISLVDLLPEAREEIYSYLNDESLSFLITIIAFFIGVFITALIDKLIPECENPHEIHLAEEMEDKKKAIKCKKLLRLGLFTAIAIAIHNLPEGLITFVGAVKDVSLGISLCVAIAIHNIPEGIAVSIPIYYATGSKKKAFVYSFLSGLTEPLGAVIGFVIFSSFLNGLIIGSLFAFVAGIMIFISFDELLPASEKYGEHHLSLYGIITGMVVISISLLLLG